MIKERSSLPATFSSCTVDFGRARPPTPRPLVVFIVSDSGDDKPIVGITQRAFVAPLLLWLMITGAKILRMPEAR